MLLWLGVPLAAPYPPNRSELGATFQPPSVEHPAGTDQFGRDVLSRVLYAQRTSLLMAAAACLTALLLGAGIGMAGGAGPAWLAWPLMRLVEMTLAVPGILMAFAALAAFGLGPVQASVAVGIGLMPLYARLGRSLTLDIIHAPYILAVEALGASPLHIFRVHLLPYVLPHMIAYAPVVLAFALVNLAALDFLGLAPAENGISLGVLLAEGRLYLREAPHLFALPSVLLIGNILAFSGLSPGLNKQKMPPEG